MTAKAETRTVPEIRKAIVEAQVKGQPTAELEKLLRQARLDEQMRAEVAELQTVADQRLKWRKEAKKVRATVKLQGEKIDRFLKLRDVIAESLRELIKVARAEGLIKAQNDCYEAPLYHDIGVFGADVRKIPRGYLPEGFTCPTLEMADGKTQPYDRAAEALWYMAMAHGLLANLAKGAMEASTRQPEPYENL